MNNQKGNSLFFGLLIFMFVSFLALKALSFKLKTIQKTRHIRQQYICMKEYNGKTRRHIKYMEGINSVIMIAKGVEYLSTLYPPLRPLIMIVNRVGGGLEATQDLVHFSYMKNYITWYQKDCYFDPRFIKTPYKHKGRLTRHKFTKAAIMRSRKWKQSLISPKAKLALETQVQQKGFSQTEYQTQEIALPQKFELPKPKQALRMMKEALSGQLF